MINKLLFKLFNVKMYDPVFPPAEETKIFELVSPYIKHHINKNDKEILMRFCAKFRWEPMGSFFRFCLTHVFFNEDLPQINYDITDSENIVRNGYLLDGFNWRQTKEYFILSELLHYIKKEISKEDLHSIQVEIGHLNGETIGKTLFKLFDVNLNPKFFEE
jgi:hypothetical protein